MTYETAGTTNWLARVVSASAVVLALMSGSAGAQDPALQELAARLDRLEQQNRQLAFQNEQLRAALQLRAPGQPQEAPPLGFVPPQGAGGPAATEQEPALSDEDIADYLAQHPGAGVPPGVQFGYSPDRGFSIRSVPNPRWDNWTDAMRSIPFELRIRGRLQLDFYSFHITDNTNYATGTQFQPFEGLNRRADFDALEVKRARLIFEGTAFDPDLKYRLQLNGDTRGLGGLFNNNQISNGSPVSGGKDALDNGGVTTDHAVRLFEAWVAYDMHPGILCAKGGSYTPTLTAIAGKMKPFCGLEEYLGSGSDQFVEFSMADWFFSPDDDNLLMAAGMLVKACDDRLYMMALLINGSESNFAANQIDDRPGFNGGLWYDFGGTWDEARKQWLLYGDSTADIDYSRCPVVRIGAGTTIAPMDRRRLYGDAEQSRFRAAVGGARIIDILNGVGSTDGIHAVDRFNSYTAYTYIAAKYKGFSIDNEYFIRYLNDFQTLPNGNDVILYQDFIGGTPHTSLFPVTSLTDYGMTLQGGYFLIPTKLELVSRWSMVRGESGNINGTGTAQTVNGVRVVNGAFRQYSTANEYTAGFNWYFRRQLLKWQTDVGYYHGGTPASASAAGFITNADGWLVRTQVQLAF